MGTDGLFDKLGVGYSTVIHCGKLIWERQRGKYLAQVWLYAGIKYALAWDIKTGENVVYTKYENVLKERMAVK